MEQLKVLGPKGFSNMMFFLRGVFFVLINLLAGGTSALAFDQGLFKIVGQSHDGNWRSVALYQATEPPEVEVVKTCLRKICTGDVYDGTYQCGECLEYSAPAEEIKWRGSIETAFYFRDKLKNSGRYDFFFLGRRANAKEIRIVAASPTLYSQVCLSSHVCFNFYAFLGGENLLHEIGRYFSDSQSFAATLLGRSFEGKMNVWAEDGSRSLLPATFKLVPGNE